MLSGRRYTKMSKYLTRIVNPKWDTIFEKWQHENRGHNGIKGESLHKGESRQVRNVIPTNRYREERSRVVEGASWSFGMTVDPGKGRVIAEPAYRRLWQLVILQFNNCRMTRVTEMTGWTRCSGHEAQGSPRHERRSKWSRTFSNPRLFFSRDSDSLGRIDGRATLRQLMLNLPHNLLNL